MCCAGCLRSHSMAPELAKFIRNCLSASEAADAQLQIGELLRELVSAPQTLCDKLGEPRRAMIEKLHVSSELTIINVVWAPKMTLLPHNHNVWAVIGVYAGRED